MQRSDNRILTTHAGSLPRPAALKTLLKAKFEGKPVDAAVFDAAVEQATDAVVAKQIAAGIDIGNNGEQGRESFFTYVQHRMTGFGGTSTRPVMADLMRYPGYREMVWRRVRDPDSVSLLAAPQAIGAVRYIDSQPIAAECVQFRRLLEGRATGFVEAFLTAPSPGIIAAAMQNVHYPSMQDYVDALATALGTEYRAIVEHGFVLQIDAPDLALERHTLFQDKPLTDFLDFVQIVVAAINRALQSVPRDRVRLHVCWGNYEGPHELDVPLEDIWPAVAKVQAGAVLLSMANPRHAHEYHCFEERALPDDVILMPGVIDTTTNYVEHPLTVADRIERVARVIGDPHRIIAGTDCGFETSTGVQAIHDDVVWAKLRALAEGAAIASKRLFS